MGGLPGPVSLRSSRLHVRLFWSSHAAHTAAVTQHADHLLIVHVNTFRSTSIKQEWAHVKNQTSLTCMCHGAMIVIERRPCPHRPPGDQQRGCCQSTEKDSPTGTMHATPCSACIQTHKKCPEGETFPGLSSHSCLCHSKNQGQSGRVGEDCTSAPRSNTSTQPQRSHHSRNRGNLSSRI